MDFIKDIAKANGIEVPETSNYVVGDYLHYHCYSVACINGTLSLAEFNENASIISKLTEDQIKGLTGNELVSLGGHFRNIPPGNYTLDNKDGVFKLDDHI